MSWICAGRGDKCDGSVSAKSTASWMDKHFVKHVQHWTVPLASSPLASVCTACFVCCDAWLVRAFVVRSASQQRTDTTAEQTGRLWTTTQLPAVMQDVRGWMVGTGAGGGANPVGDANFYHTHKRTRANRQTHAHAHIGRHTVGRIVALVWRLLVWHMWVYFAQQ